MDSLKSVRFILALKKNTGFHKMDSIVVFNKTVSLVSFLLERKTRKCVSLCMQLWVYWETIHFCTTQKYRAQGAFPQHQRLHLFPQAAWNCLAILKFREYYKPNSASPPPSHPSEEATHSLHKQCRNAKMLSLEAFICLRGGFIWEHLLLTRYLLDKGLFDQPESCSRIKREWPLGDFHCYS